MKANLRKDTKRYMRVDDIEGASPKERDLIPEGTLPGLHPMFQERNEMRKELKEIANGYKARDKYSKGMAEVLNRNESLREVVEGGQGKSESPNKAASKYKQIHDRWL